MAKNEETFDANAPVTMVQLMAFFQKMSEDNSKQAMEMLKTVVAEIRKPPIDPVREVQKAREKATKERGEKEYWEKKANRKKNCAHLRQGGSCVIAWAVQSDGVERGVCPHCESVFTPEDGEQYQQLRRLNRGMVESVRYVS